MVCFMRLPSARTSRSRDILIWSSRSTGAVSVRWRLTRICTSARGRFFYSAGARDKWSQSPIKETKMKLYKVLCTQGSLERFLRLTQKIPISLSGAKVEHRDATVLEWSQGMSTRDKVQGQKHTMVKLDSVGTLSGVQSVNGATQRLRVEAFMCVVSRMLHHSYISSSLSCSFFPWCREMRRMRRDAIHMRERKHPVVSEL